jgi:hypothetical protein
VKNGTITLKDAIADSVRIDTAKRSASVSRMLGEMVPNKMRLCGE